MSIEQIRERLQETSTLLCDAAAGDFGDTAVYKALAVFRSLTDGQVWVHVERRANRKRTNVRGTFRPQLFRGIVFTTLPSVTVWLRQPPRMDAIAERVHELIDMERLSHRETAKQLRREGYAVNSGNVWYSYKRWYEMQGIEPPKVPYNNGKRRRSDEALFSRI